MVPPAEATDQVTAVDCPVVVPETVAWKVMVPLITTEATDGGTVTAMTGAGCTTVKLRFGPSCQTEAESCQVTYAYHPPGGSAEANERDRPRGTAEPGCSVYPRR